MTPTAGCAGTSRIRNRLRHTASRSSIAARSSCRPWQRRCTSLTPCCPRALQSAIAPSTWMLVGAGVGRPGDRGHLCPRSQPHCQWESIGDPLARSPEPIGPGSLAEASPGRLVRRVHQSDDCRSLVIGAAVAIVGVRPLGLRDLRPAGPLRGGDAGQRPHRERRRWLRYGLPSAQFARGVRPVSPRILRRGPGCGSVRLTGAVDRLRSHQREPSESDAVVLAACDPANPYGAALPWPDREGHRPGRKAGAGGAGRWCADLLRGTRRQDAAVLHRRSARLEPAATALARSVQQGLLGKLTVERADGAHVFGSIPVSAALQAAGFRMTPGVVAWPSI